MTQQVDIGTLRERNVQLRRDLARAFQEAEQVVLGLAEELFDAPEAQQTMLRLDLRQANQIRDKFLATWQELSKGGWSA